MPAYKSERGTYYASFYYTDWTGKRKKKKKEGFATKREAQAFERQFIEQQAGAPTMTFGSLYNLYKADAAKRVRKSTLRVKCVMAETHILPYFKDITIDKITPATVRAWQNEMLTLNFSPNYLYSLHRNLSTIMNFAVRYYGLPSNPVTHAGPVGKVEVHQAYWTIDDFRKFAMAIDRPEYIMLFYILFWTGCRIGEALALEWDDINGNTMRISKTISRIGGDDYVRPPKTKESIRSINLPSFIVEMLDDYKRMTAHTGPRLFHRERRTILRYFYSRTDMAGLHRIRIHDLRHSHASMLIHAGVPPIAIAERLGHKNAQTTLRVYSHLYKSAKDKVVSVLESL